MKSSHGKQAIWVPAVILLISLFALSACSSNSPPSDAGVSDNDASIGAGESPGVSTEDKVSQASIGKAKSIEIADSQEFTDEIANSFVTTLSDFVKTEFLPQAGKLLVERDPDLDGLYITYYCFCYDKNGNYLTSVHFMLFKNKKAMEEYDSIGSRTPRVENALFIEHSAYDGKFINDDYATARNLIGNSCSLFYSESMPTVLYDVDLISNQIQFIEHDDGRPKEDDYYLTETTSVRKMDNQGLQIKDYTFDKDTLELTSMSVSYEFAVGVDPFVAIQYDSVYGDKLQDGAYGEFDYREDPSCYSLKIIFNRNYFNEYMEDTSYAGIKAGLDAANLTCDTYENGIQD